MTVAGTNLTGPSSCRMHINATDRPSFLVLRCSRRPLQQPVFRPQPVPLSSTASASSAIALSAFPFISGMLVRPVLSTTRT